MKTNRIIATVCSLTLGAALSLTTIGCKKANNAKVNVNDLYAVSAASGAEYLSKLDKDEKVVNASLYPMSATFVSAKEPATERPSDFSGDGVNRIKDCISMFDGMIDGGVKQSVSDNDGTKYPDYPLVMTIAVGNETFEMYYKEISTKTETETDEDGTQETETSTVLGGIMLYNGNEYKVDGKKELETEGDESEYSVKFKTSVDDDNYVKIAYEVEKELDESQISYKYEICRNGVKEEIELEYEEENGKGSVSFKLKSEAENGSKKKYKIEQGGKDGVYKVKLEEDGRKIHVTVTEKENGYEFAYSNGYRETIAF